MFSNARGCFAAAIMFAIFVPGTVVAQDFDCAAYENYAGAEPAGYADACLDGITLPTKPKAAGDQVQAVTDTAFALDIGFVSDNALEHQHGDLASNVIVGTSALPIFGLDYSPDLGTLYAIDITGNQLGTFDGTTFTPIGVMTPNGAESWSGLTIDPVTGDAYASSTDCGTGSSFYSVDLGTGVATLIGTDTTSICTIDLAMNCEGEIYTHDIVSDSIFSLDPATGIQTLVGSTGVLSNFAQGMDFDNDTGELYAYTYQGSGANQYGTIDLGSGALTPLNTDNPLGEFEGASQTVCPGQVGPARFAVSKDFSDDNTAEVSVTLSCNTGLPLEQTTTIAEGDPVNFVVNDFEPGAMDCVVTEDVPVGYTAQYNNGEADSDESCVFVEVSAGQRSCQITNTLDPVEVEVTKVWIDENPQFNGQNIADATWSCTNAPFCIGVAGVPTTCSGFLNFFGNPDSDSFEVLPDWENGTVCDVTEVMVADGGVEIDDSECQNLTVWPGVGAECTIYNTRLYEGIPTLSQYGLGVLVLLMLGMGFVAVRRFV